MRAFSPILSLLLLLPAVVFAQPDTLWSCRIAYGTPGPKINGGAALAGDGFVVVGVNNPEAANQNMFIAHVSDSGQVLWTREFGQITWNEQANAVIELPSSDLVLVGYGGIGTEINYIVLIGINANGDSLWYRSYFGYGLAKGNDAVVLDNGNFAVCGYRLGQGEPANSDAWLLLCEPDGDTLWTRTYGGAGTDIGGRILQGPGGTLVMGAYTTTWGAGDYDFWLLRTDSQGNQLSATTFGTAGQEICYGMALREDEICLGGRTGSAITNDGYLAKANGTGGSVWAYPYNFGQVEEQIRGIALRHDGSIACAGWSGSSPTSVAPWYMVVRPDGSVGDLYVYSSLRPGRFMGLVSVPAGGFLAYGYITAGSQQQGYLLRISPGYGVAGTVRNLDTEQPLAGIRVAAPASSRLTVTDGEGRFMLELQPGTYDLVASGRCVSTDTLRGVELLPDTTIEVEISLGIPRYQRHQTSLNFIVQNHVLTVKPFLIRNPGSGPLEFWAAPESLYPPTGWLTIEPTHGFVPAADSFEVNVMVLTDTTDDAVYDYFGYLELRLNACPDSLDCLPVLVTVLDVPATSESSARSFALHGAYPNPFNAMTTLSFSVGRTSPVRLTLYDLTGRLAGIILDEALPAGQHRATLDARALPSGLYFVRMEAGDFAASQKVLLVK